MKQKKLLIFSALFVLLAVGVVMALVSIQNTSPANAVYTTSTTPTFTFDVTGDNLTYNCSVWIDGSIYGTNVSVANNTLTNITNITASALSEATHIWYVNCTQNNSEALTSNVTANRTITVDTTPPTIDTVAGVSNNTITSNSSLNITIGVTDTNLNFTNVSLVDSSGDSVNTTIDATASFTADIWAPADGVYNVTITVYDLAGQTATESYSNITFDATPPFITQVLPIDGGFLNSLDVTFNWTTDDAAATCDLYLNDSDTAELSDIPASTGTDYNASFTFTEGGEYDWSVNCSDAVANEDETAFLPFIVDVTPPTVLIAAPTNNSEQATRNIVVAVVHTEQYLNYTNISIYNATGYNVNTTTNATPNFTITLTVPHDGIFNVTVTAFDNATNSYMSTVMNVTVDTAEPTIALVLPENNTYSSSASVTFNWTAADTHTVNCTLYVNGSANVMGIAAQSGSNFNKTITLTETLHNWSVDCSDNYNNTASSSTARNVTVDLTAPNITSVTGQNSSVVQAGTINLTINITETNINTTNVSIMSGSTVVNSSATSNKNFTVSLGAADGTYNVTITSYDLAGRSSIVNITNITIDNGVPTITQTRPISGGFLNGLVVTFNWTTDDSAATCDLYLNGSATATQSSIAANSGTNYNASYNFTAGGVYNWSINCSDTLGNDDATTFSPFIVDVTSPVSVITTPSNHSTQASRDIVVTVNSTETYLNYTSVAIIYSNGSTVNSTTNDTLNFAETLTVPLDGTFNVSVTTYDDATNTVTKLAYNITVDITAPTITLDLPDNRSVETADVLFNWTASDTHTVNCTLYIDGAANTTVAAASGSVFNDTLTFVDGMYIWSVDCSDTYNNTDSSAARNFTVDINTTVLTLVYPTDALFTNDTTLDMNWTALDVNYLNCLLFINGTQNASNVANVSATLYNVSSVTFGQGGWNWNVTCFDNVTNVTTASSVQTFTVDTTTTNTNVSQLNASVLDNGSILLNWTASSNADMYYYRVYMSNGTITNLSAANVDLMGNTTGLGFVVSTSLTDAVQYFFVLSGVDRALNQNTSNFSVEANETAACTADYTYDDWSTCSGGEKSRDGTRTCSTSGATTTSTETDTCSSGNNGGGGAPTAPTQRSTTFAEITENQQATMTVSDLVVSSISFIAAADAESVRLTVQEVTTLPSTVPVREKTYKYLSITISQANLVKSAGIEFSVTKAWLTEQGLTADQIRLFRHDGTQWVELPTTILSSDATSYKFKATSPGFSIFAIGMTTIGPSVQVTPPVETTPPVTPPTADVVAEPTAPDTTTPPLDESVPEKKESPVIWVVALLVVLVLLGAIFLLRRKHNR